MDLKLSIGGPISRPKCSPVKNVVIYIGADKSTSIIAIVTKIYATTLNPTTFLGTEIIKVLI